MILTKPISPKKLNDQAMRKVILDEMRDIADDIVKDFRKTTKTWKHKPSFEKLFQLSSGEVSILVGTDDEIYGYVNDGTVRHWVEPKKAKALRFQSVYTAKTYPKMIDSARGGASGEFWFSKGHYVNGIKARNFDEAIQDDWEPRFKDRMEKAYAKSAKVSGNEI